MTPPKEVRELDASLGCSCGTGTCEDCARDMRRMILNVRQLHRPIKRSSHGLEVCASCTELVRIGERHNPKRPGVAYPCATIRTLDGNGADLSGAPTA